MSVILDNDDVVGEERQQRCTGIGIKCHLGVILGNLIEYYVILTVSFVCIQY